MRALVTDAHVRSAVWFIRALLRAGVPVHALGPTATAAGRWSRGLSGRATGADVGADPDRFAEAVAAVARRDGPLVVYPGREESIDALLDRAGGLPPQAVLPYPAAGVLRRVRDKRALPELAAAAGLETPATLYEGPAGPLRDAPVDGPCILKPLDKGKVLARTHVLASAAELRGALGGVPDDEVVVVQEVATGPLAALCLVVGRDGEPVARLQQETRRTWPAEAGPSRLAVTVAPDEDLTARVTAMLAAAGFWGLAQVQFLQGPDGPRIIDVNPRPYGSLPLAVAAGVNLPAAWHAVATGARPPAPGPYRVGVTFRWLEAELFAALHGEHRALARRPPRPRVGAMWAEDDPVASALLAAHATSAWLVRQAGRLRRVGAAP